MHNSFYWSVLRRTFVHVTSVAFCDAHYSQVSLVHGQQTKYKSILWAALTVSIAVFPPTSEASVPLGAANVSDIDPSSGSRLLLAAALHQKLWRCSSVPLSKVAQQFDLLHHWSSFITDELYLLQVCSVMKKEEDGFSMTTFELNLYSSFCGHSTVYLHRACFKHI